MYCVCLVSSVQWFYYNVSNSVSEQVCIAGNWQGLLKQCADLGARIKQRVHTLTGRFISDRVEAAGTGGHSQQDAHFSAQRPGSPASIMSLGLSRPLRQMISEKLRFHLSLRCLTGHDDEIGVRTRPCSWEHYRKWVQPSNPHTVIYLWWCMCAHVTTRVETRRKLFFLPTFTWTRDQFQVAGFLQKGSLPVDHPSWPHIINFFFF